MARALMVVGSNPTDRAREAEFRGRVDEYLLTMELATERLVPHLMRFAVRTPAPSEAAA